MTDEQRLIAGRYQITGLMQRLGETDYYAALDNRTSRPVTLRIINTAEQGAVGAGLEHLAADKLRRKMEHETRLLHRLHHPGLLTLLDWGFDAPLYYHVYPAFAFHNLAQALARYGRMPHGQVVTVARQAAATLAGLHESGIVHCDISAQTLLLLDGQVRIIEFSIANHAAPEHVAPGDPPYMSPEAVTGAKPAPARDVWALGVTLYYALVGELPFGAVEAPRQEGVLRLFHRILHEEPPPVPALVPDVPPAFADLIMRMLQKDPAQRPTSMQQVLAALDTLGSA